MWGTKGNKPKSRKNQTNTPFSLIVVGHFTFLYEPYTLFGIPLPTIKPFFSHLSSIRLLFSAQIVPFTSSGQIYLRFKFLDCMSLML